MKVLVTGGLGQIGSHVSEMLISRKDKVLVIDNLETGRIEHLSENENLQIKIGDISDKNFLGSFSNFKPELLLHTAASYKDPDDWYNDTLTNCVGA